MPFFVRIDPGLFGLPEWQHLPQGVVLDDQVVPKGAADVQYQQHQQRLKSVARRSDEG